MSRNNNGLKNPVTTALLRERFGDGQWRTTAEMGGLLSDVIPVATATRALAGKPAYHRIPLPDQIAAGQRLLVGWALSQAGSGSRFESRKVKGRGVEYRYVGETPRDQVVRPRNGRRKKVKRGKDWRNSARPLRQIPARAARLTAEDLSRPDPHSIYGASAATVYRVITDHPGGLTNAEIVALLDPCFVEEPLISAYERALQRRRTGDQPPPRISREQRLAAAKADFISRMLASLKRYGVRAEAPPARFYPPSHSESETNKGASSS
jgi:hypothetical protein